MRWSKPVTLLGFILIIFLFNTFELEASSGSVVEPASVTQTKGKGKNNNAKYYSIKELEHLLGRKMNLAERIVFKLHKKKFVKPDYATGANPEENATTNVWAIVSLVTAIFLPPLGIVFGIIALNQIKRTGQKGQGLAIAGIVIGGVLTLIYLVYIIAWSVAWMAFW